MAKVANNKPKPRKDYTISITVRGSKLESIEANATTFTLDAWGGPIRYDIYKNSYKVTPKWLLKKIGKLLEKSK